MAQVKSAQLLSVWFAEPSWLLCLLLVPLLWWLRSRPGSSRSRLRSLGSGVFRSLALAATVGALAQPMWDEEIVDRERVLVLDRSASISEDALDRALTGFSPPPEEVVVHSLFSGDPSDPAAGTDLRSALESGLGAVRGATDRRLVLVSDGAHSGPPLDSLLSLARARGVPIDVLPIPPRRRAPRVLDFQPPQDRIRGEKLRVPLSLSVTQAGPVRMTIQGSDGSRSETELELSQGDNDVVLDWRPKSSGLIVAELDITPVDASSGVVNARARALVRVRPKPRALLVGDEEGTRRLAKSFSGLSSPMGHTSRARLPAPPYRDYRVIALLDPDFEGLSQQKVDGLVRWVRDGGRLIVSGGPAGLVTDSPRLDGIAELLPVRFPKTKKKERAPLSVVYCLDRSDSMAGSAKFELAAAALAQSLHVLPEAARVGIIGFADFPTWVLPFGELQGTAAAIDALAGVEVKGGTSIYHGLQAAYEALRHDDSMVKHVIVLSDGQSTTTFSRHGDVVNLMKGQEITVSTIAVSEDSDRSELERIARAGAGRSYYTDNFRDLPKLFLDEMMIVTRTNKVEEAISVHAIEGSRLLKGVPQELEWPSLGGYVRGQQKAGSELGLATSEGQPLLTSGRFGRGVVTLFTSDIGGSWTKSWREWEPEPGFWRSVLGATLEPHSPELLRLSTRPTGEGAWVEVDAVDSLRNPRGDLVIEAIVEEESGRRQVWRMPAVGPGRYGGELRFEDFEPRLLSAAAVGTTDRNSPTAPGGEVFTSLRMPPPLEARLPSSNVALLRHVADETGGGVLENLEETLRGDPGVRVESRSLWSWLLRLAFCCFLVDVAFRRLRW